MFAVMGGHNGTVLLLVEEGADVNVTRTIQLLSPRI